MAYEIKDMMDREDGLGTIHCVASVLGGARSNASLPLKGTLGCAGKKMKMKKLMIAASAALCATVGFSAITSANVVGYATQKISGGKLSCVAYQFSDVGAKEDFASIATLSTTGLTAGQYDTMNTDAPCIMFYNGSSYDCYYYISDAYNADGDTVTAWADANGDAADATQELGTGFWLRVPEATCTEGTLTAAGQVGTGSTKTVNIDQGLTLVGNPFPTAANLSKVETTGLTAGTYDTMNTDAPCIMVYNGSAYDCYYYISDAYDADGNGVTAWADTNGDAITDGITVTGEAFWVRSPTAGKLTFSL